MRIRTAIRTRLVAAALVGGLTLAGCGGSGDSGESSSKDGPTGGHHEAGPLPAQPTTGPGDTTSGAAEGEQRDFAPSPTPDPDYLSTFALDVDTASYGYARRTLAQGRLPDPSTVRPEEFVNSFPQDYPRPDGNGFSVTVDGARTDEDRWSLVRVGLATGAPEGDPGRDAARRPPAALTFVIDISGSMAEPGRLDLVRESLDLMVDRLRDDDSLALVTFSGNAETRLPMTRLGDSRSRIHEVIDGLQPTDSTNVEAGITTGYQEAVEGRRPGATNRVVLLSDALANTGDTSADGILERVADARREHGITLFGVGVGSEYGDAFMERLTNRGDGHTTYVSDTDDARAVFTEELPRHIELRARDAKAQVAFDPATVEQFRLIGYENREVADEDFRDDRVDGGEIGPSHTVTALYAVRTRPGASGHVATATVRWLDPSTRAPHEESGTVETGALERGLWTQEDSGFQVAALAAYFADALRRPSSGWSGSSDYARLPGALPLPGLADRAARIAESSDSRPVRDLASAIRQAEELAG
ncbi:VWA domain-containing protein [Streptomyces sp. GC420]|uniref:vWA domain-containing protein n=1 Tax=Streptomyces sp. GC420 TaxID=2697568 RepID=UPI001414E8A5|nr:von Willebrand factor type A domain-containing protein [Streptomyces sp. GC420]NBM19851.1 DUF3520 domain-containing protein [Streptomyces sp. GC420]